MSNPWEPTPQQQIILDNLMNGIYFIDTKRSIVYGNTAAEHISGFKLEEISGKSCLDKILVNAAGDDVLYCEHCPLLGSSKNAAPPVLAASLRHKDGYCVSVRRCCVPLLDEGSKIVGAVEIFERADIQEALSLQVKELKRIAYRDSLTEAPNRRCMEEALNEWMLVHEKKDWPFAVAMGDIDFFKNVNDKYGHDAGDLVLKKVASTLQKHLRSVDAVGRWGGEEFLILMQNIRERQLRKRLESLRKAIEESSVEDKGVEIKVTMSFGCTVPRKGDTPLSLVSRADDLLYKSKREGRNRVSVDDASSE
ncbi:MAG: sensor domain-containing diguanylate cyclase [Synergistaceae bacterium]|nr:sensor domain-containing diguanylate cyclase [Synergistaceae bacterium]